MIINHNIAALNTHRQLGMNNMNASKNLEKLSSGLKINRAGDDAAGLAISEKMRGQIRGLDMAQKNSQDGISLLQTAEGALNETHDILQRMRELAVQSSNDTNTGTDRAELQKEVDQLAQEITRISDQTEFNSQKLLDGSFADKKFHIGANTGQNITIDINQMNTDKLDVIAVTGEASKVSGLVITNSTGESLTVKFAAAQTGPSNSGVKETTAKVSGNTITVTLAQTAGNGTTSGGVSATRDQVAAALTATGLTTAAVSGATGATVVATGANTTVKSATIASGGKNDPTKGINITNQRSASAAIKTINTAIETVSAERSKLGATQNRLEHTINNLGTSSENLTAAESRIRDVDMAKEMMSFTKNNILTQAAQAMLAQANQQPQGVLQLLR